MQNIDYIIIVVALIGFIFGYIEGFLRKVIGICGLVLGVYLAFKLNDYVWPFFLNFFEGDKYLSQIAAGIVIYFAITFSSAVLKRIVHPFHRFNFFINRFLGGVVGSIQVIIYLSIILVLLINFNIPDKSSMQKSRYYKKVVKIVPNVLNKITDTSNTIRETVNQMMSNLDE